MADHTTISPVSFESTGLDDDATRLACENFLQGIVGTVCVQAAPGALAGVSGISSCLADLGVMTCYFPPRPLTVCGSHKPGHGRVLMVRSMQGRLEVRQNGITVTAETGDFLFVSGEQPFEWHLPEGGRLDCGSISLQAVSLPPEKLARLYLRPVPRSFPPLQLLITYAAYLLISGQRPVREADMANVHFNNILPHVIAYLEAPQAQARPDRLSPVKAYIDTHLAEDLGVATIAGVLGVTPRYIQKLFQQEGTTFSKFLLERRLAAARNLLVQDTGERPISAIAYEVGFGDLSYFNRSFRRRYGSAPSLFRKAVDATGEKGR